MIKNILTVVGIWAVVVAFSIPMRYVMGEKDPAFTQSVSAQEIKDDQGYSVALYSGGRIAKGWIANKILSHEHGTIKFLDLHNSPVAASGTITVEVLD